MSFPSTGKIRIEPEPLQERPKFLRLGLEPPDIWKKDVRDRVIRRRMAENFGGRHARVLSWLQQPASWRHNSNDLGACKPHCPQCDIEKRASEGRPVMQFVLEVELDHPWKTAEQPRPHKNRRQQKKWARLGVTVTRAVRVTETWVMTPQQFHTLRDMWQSLRYV